LKIAIDLHTIYPADWDSMMDVIALGAGFSGGLAAAGLSRQGFIDRQHLRNVIHSNGHSFSYRSASLSPTARALLPA
jgi:hypothetical protein